MGDFLPTVEAGLRVACPPVPTSFDVDALEGEGDDGGLSTVRADGHERFGQDVGCT